MQITCSLLVRSFCLGALLITWTLAFAQSNAQEAKEPPTPTRAQVDFARDVQPIFQARCISCHGSEVQMSGLRLDNRLSLLKGGKSGIAGDCSGKKLRQSADSRMFLASIRKSSCPLRARGSGRKRLAC